MERGALAGTLLLFTTLANAIDCEDMALSSSVGLVHSKWHEVSASGAPLVKETGTLRATRLDAHTRCGFARWHVHWAQAEGQRRYSGMTNTQRQAASTTDIQDQTVQLEGFIDLTAHWSVGLGVAHRSIRRNIQSTEQALGYPEHFSYRAGLAGLRYQTPSSETTKLDFVLWTGRTSGGQVWLDLPNADPTRLTLGSGRVVQASLTWAATRTSRPGWSWGSTFNWRATTMDAGSPGVLTNKGRLVGVARQPRTRTESLGVSATLQYVF